MLTQLKNSVQALNVNNNDKFNMLYSKAITRTWPKSSVTWVFHYDQQLTVDGSLHSLSAACL